MAAVARGLRLVPALAVSGTVLYFAYGYKKKKAFVNIRRGLESWRLECQYGGKSAIQQQQSVVTKEQSVVCLELRKGEDALVGEEVQPRQLSWFWKAVQRGLSHEPSSIAHFLSCLSEAPADLLLKGRQDLERILKDRFVKCKADAAQVNDFHETHLSYTAKEQQQEEQKEHGTNFATAVTLPSGVYQSDLLGRLDSRDNILVKSPPSYDCRTKEKSETSSSPSSRTVTLVSCLVRPGSRKTANKPKKVVRFSPSVAEPSSNNQDYRSRCTTHIAQRAALQMQVQQQTHVPPANHADSVEYSPHRYRGRSYYGSYCRSQYMTHVNPHSYRGRSYYGS